MRTTINILLTIFLLSACSSQSTKRFHTSAWEDFGYEGMAGKINRLAGTTSANCGIRNHLASNDPVNKQMSVAQSRSCIKTAIKQQTPFRYGSIRIPIDSFLFSALVLSQTGEFWLIDFDSMIDGSGSLHNIKKCSSVQIDYLYITFNGTDCQPVSAQEWLADIPEQQQD